MKNSLVGLVLILIMAIMSLNCQEEDKSSAPKSNKPEVTMPFYLDADQDSYGDPSFMIWASTLPAGYSQTPGDCNDYDVTVHPGAPETCDAIDNDCDRDIDEGLVFVNFYLDQDADGFGGMLMGPYCSQPAEFVSTTGDCNDLNANIYPGAPELCDQTDNDCDTHVDEGLVFTNYYLDADLDGYGNPWSSTVACSAPTSFPFALVTDNTDCNDNAANINPGAKELLCNQVDENCDNNTGPTSTKLYSIDNLDGIIYYYRGGFVSYFDGSISPWLNGFFTFDISSIDWNYVKTAFVNAYMVGEFQPCDPGDVFYPPKFRLNDMADEYYAAFINCGCRMENELVCPDTAINEQCQFLFNEVLYSAMPDGFTPWYASGPYDHIQTSNWWKADVTDNYFAPIGDYWTDLNKEYISVFPDTGACVHCVSNSGCYPYIPHSFNFEDGGNHSNTGNVPYLEVTCP